MALSLFCRFSNLRLPASLQISDEFWTHRSGYLSTCHLFHRVRWWDGSQNTPPFEARKLEKLPFVMPHEPILADQLREQNRSKGEEDMERQKKLVKKSRVIKVGSEESWDLYVSKASKQGYPVAVHFSAAWCTPSRAMSPFFEELALEYKGVVFLSVDVDEAKEVASKMEIKAMPTFVLMKDGAPNIRLVGANPVELRKSINGFLYG